MTAGRGFGGTIPAAEIPCSRTDARSGHAVDDDVAGPDGTEALGAAEGMVSCAKLPTAAGAVKDDGIWIGDVTTECGTALTPFPVAETAPFCVVGGVR